MRPRIDQTAIVGHPPEDKGWDPDIPGVPPRVAQTARIEAYVTVDAGIQRPTRIGDRTWLLKHVHIGHDAQVGDGCTLATGTIIGGWAEIGNNVRTGINATVLPFRKIGDNAVIGAGAVVTKDVPAGETWAGNPARKLDDNERDPRPHSQRTAPTLRAA